MFPLKKVAADGTPYVRPPAIRAAIDALLRLPEADLVAIARAGAWRGSRLPGECLLHLARWAARTGRPALFTEAWTAVERRIARAVRARTRGGALPLTSVAVHELVLDRLRERMAIDAWGHCDGLDYYEIRFDSALAAAISDARRSVGRETALRHPLEDDAGALLPQVERAMERADRAGGCDAESEYRMVAIGRALPSLPELQRRIVELLLEGLPIAARDAATPSVSGRLRRSERSVRDHRDAAFRRIRRVYERGGGSRPDCCASPDALARGAGGARP